MRYESEISESQYLEFSNRSRKLSEGLTNSLQKLFLANRQHKFGNLVGVKNSAGELIAIAFILRFANRVIYISGDTNQEAKNTGAMTYLLTQEIINSHGKYKIFDFEGGNYPGSETFYRSFGALPSHYSILRSNIKTDS